MYLMCQMCSATLAILVEARRLRHLFIGSTLPSNGLAVVASRCLSNVCIISCTIC